MKTNALKYLLGASAAGLITFGGVGLANAASTDTGTTDTVVDDTSTVDTSTEDTTVPEDTTSTDDTSTDDTAVPDDTTATDPTIDAGRPQRDGCDETGGGAAGTGTDGETSTTEATPTVDATSI